MALKKELISVHGVKVTYWKIGTFNHNPVHKYVEMQLYGYIDEDIRNAKMEPIETKRIRCIWNKFDEYFSADILEKEGINPHTQGYKFIKENIPEFKDAEDVK